MTGVAHRVIDWMGVRYIGCVQDVVWDRYRCGKRTGGRTVDMSPTALRHIHACICR